MFNVFLFDDVPNKANLLIENIAVAFVILADLLNIALIDVHRTNIFGHDSLVGHSIVSRLPRVC